jgi:hypothetical protein
MCLSKDRKSDESHGSRPGTRVGADIAAKNDYRDDQQRHVIGNTVDRQTNGSDGKDKYTELAPSPTGSASAHRCHGNRSGPAPNRPCVAC